MKQTILFTANRCSMRRLVAAATALLALAMLAPNPARAQAVLFSDSFSREVNPFWTDSSWGTNDNALGGHLLTQPYLVNTNLQQWVDGFTGLLRGNGSACGSARILVDFATNAPGGFSLSFKARRSLSGGFVGFTLGLGPTNATGGFPPLDAGADFTFLLKPPAGGQMRCEVLTNGVSVPPGNYGAFGEASEEHLIVATLTPNGYSGAATIAITVDGTNAFTGQPNFNGNFTWQNDGNQGYITFSANQPDATIDDIVITALNAAPQITSQPVSRTNAVGSSASFTVGALGLPPLNYQWYFITNNTTNLLLGANSPTLTRDPVAYDHAGSYFAIVTNQYGSATSAPAILTVVAAAPPTIDVHPANVTVNRGQPASFEVVASGAPPLTFQWRKNGASVAGAATNPYAIASTAYTDAGTWSVVITNAYGAITSNPALLTVNDITAPIVSDATNVIVAPASPAGTVVNLSYVAAVDDKDGAVPAALAPPSGSLFPPGVTVVTASAADAAGNVTRLYFTVTVSLATAAWQTNFFDSFDVPEFEYSEDINYRIALGRQRGLLAPLGYTELATRAQYGQFDYLSRVGDFSYPGTLTFAPSSPNPNIATATPAREFLESPTFAVEFDVQPAAGAGTTDWAGVAIGSPFPHVTPDVTGSGLGVLFRGNNQISVIQNQQQTLLQNYPWTLPTPPYRVRLEVQAAAFDGSPALVRGFVNGTPFPLSTNAAGPVYTLVKTNGFVNNFVVLSGFAQNAGTATHTFDNFTVLAQPSIFAWPPELATVVGRGNQSLSVSVPPSLVATSTVSVVISNSQPAVATLAGESGGLLTLNFLAGGPATQSIAVTAHSAGTAMFTLANPSAAVPIGGRPVIVNVDGLPEYIYNGSFEEPPVPAWPGYGVIPGWTDSLTTSNGISPNTAFGGVIANNSRSGHGRHVAFLQSLGTLGAIDGLIATTITNLTPGRTYQVSFVANAQQGAQGNAILGVFLDNEFRLSAQVDPVGGSLLGYKPVSLVFTAATTTASLAISNSTLNASGLLVDNFHVKALAPARWNSALWTGDADSGISSAHTYTHAYNLGQATDVTLNGIKFTGVGGANPTVPGRFSYTAPNVQNPNAQNNLTGDSFNLGGAFVYGNARLTLEGLTAGATYQLRLFGAGFGPNDGRRVSTWSGGGQMLTVDENAPGQGNGIIVTYDYTAASSTESVEVRNVGFGTYHVWAFANQLVALPAVLTIKQVSPTQVRIAWPAAATGYQLQASSSVAGGYANLAVTPILEGDEWVVYQSIAGEQFYRLIR